MTEVISVRFRGGCKNYYFDPKNITFKRGGKVIVETARGLEYGKVTLTNATVKREELVHRNYDAGMIARDFADWEPDFIDEEFEGEEYYDGEDNYDEYDFDE